MQAARRRWVLEDEQLVGAPRDPAVAFVLRNPERFEHSLVEPLRRVAVRAADRDVVEQDVRA
jgi:hypothetical protein